METKSNTDSAQPDSKPRRLPLGFRWAGVACGIKESGKPDLSIIFSDKPCVAAGVYTQNVVRAASIDWNRKVTPTDCLKAVVINSGNANACTGTQGEGDNRAMACELSDKFQGEAEQVCVLSTGIIGHVLPINNVFRGIDSAYQELGSTPKHFESASEGILTTDKSSKTAFRSVQLNGREVNIAAMAKGAGMIGPNMATMLAIVTTDAKLEANLAKEIITRVANQSFNRISVEGHTSTNDALLLLASGASEAGDLSEEDLATFESELTSVCIELAKQIPTDGEGATHLISIEVSGAASDADAEQIARSIAQSNLVKTAITGADPNWGRIVSAAGYCGVQFDANEMSLRLNDHLLFELGQPTELDANATAVVSKSISESVEVRIDLNVGSGKGRASHWTSDLTVDYVRFNSEYHT